MVSCPDRDIGTWQWAAKSAAHTQSVGALSAEIRARRIDYGHRQPSVARGRCGSERDSRERDSRGQPHFPRSSPRSSSAVGVRRRQPGERDEGTAARARRTQPVRARGRWRRPRWASRPSRACSGLVQPLSVQRSIQRRAVGAGDLEVACVGRRGARFGEPLPFGEQPLQRLNHRGVQWCREVLPGGVQVGQSGLHELTRKKQPDRPSEQHAEQWHVPQQEQPEVHRRGTRHEVDEDVAVRVRLHPNRQLVGEVADRLLGAFTEQSGAGSPEAPDDRRGAG